MRVLLQRKQQAQRHGADRKNGGEKAHLYYQHLEIKGKALHPIQFTLQNAERERDSLKSKNTRGEKEIFFCLFQNNIAKLVKLCYNKY